jgi:hypothetical protein
MTCAVCSEGRSPKLQTAHVALSIRSLAGLCFATALSKFACAGAPFGLACTVLKPKRLIACLHDMAVVREPIQERRGHLGIAKDLRPLAKRQVGGNHHAGVLIQLGQKMKQQRTTNLTEWQIPQLIQNHQIHARQAQRQPSRFARCFLLLQRIDQIHRAIETHPLAVMPDAADSQGSGQCVLPVPGPPIKTALCAPSVNDRLAN